MVDGLNRTDDQTRPIEAWREQSLARIQAVPWLLFIVTMALAAFFAWKAYGPEDHGDPLATSLLWGFADFGGGLLTRRFPALTVVVVSQAAAAAVLGVVVAAENGWHEAGPRLWFAVAAGVVGPAAMLFFYRALALGPMGVVSPLAASRLTRPDRPPKDRKLPPTWTVVPSADGAMA